MNETMVAVVGNVATQPVYRELATGASTRFRLAVTARYLDREKNVWTDGHTNFFTVWANRQLATNATASLNVGDPVVVQGRLKVRTDARDGQPRTSVDIDAVSIGHDLARGTSAFRRAKPGEVVTASGVGPGTGPGTGGGAGDSGQPEPDWETPAADAGAQGRAEPAMVT
jgi:single-strand DNA-binding protein